MPWQPQRRDRTRTLALVLLLHVGLGGALLHGLAGEPLRRATEALATFDVPLPQPEPLPPPAPRQPEPNAAPRETGTTDLQAMPAPLVPLIRVPLSPTVNSAAEIAPETATAPDAGASREAGNGLVAGVAGAGSGDGGSGAGDGSGTGAQARLLSGNLSRGDYRRIRDFGAPRGQAVLTIEVGPDGRLTRCLPFATSGNPALDGELCRLLARTRWEPARDRAGNPVAVALRYVATWSRD